MIPKIPDHINAGSDTTELSDNNRLDSTDLHQGSLPMSFRSNLHMAGYAIKMIAIAILLTSCAQESDGSSEHTEGNEDPEKWRVEEINPLLRDGVDSLLTYPDSEISTLVLPPDFYPDTPQEAANFLGIPYPSSQSWEDIHKVELAIYWHLTGSNRSYGDLNFRLPEPTDLFLDVFSFVYQSTPDSNSWFESIRVALGLGTNASAEDVFDAVLGNIHDETIGAEE